MALSSSALSASIRSKLLSKTASKATDNAALTAMCDAIAEAVVDHIKLASVVTITGVTTCGAGPGTCTGSGTVA